MKKTSRAVLLALSACAAAAGAVAECRAAGVADFGWMAGRWVDESGGDLSEETWGPPSGDCLSGMWRWVVGGKAKLYELLTITAEPDGVVLRLRHFDRAGVGWEDRDSPLVLRLVRSSEGEAVFQGKGSEGFLRITYRREDAATLTSAVERGASEKDLKREEFRFRRKPL